MKLSHFLLDQGFFSILGMPENIYGEENRIVKKGDPLTTNVNNSTIVVYDEGGLPWVHSLSIIEDTDILHKKLQNFGVNMEEIWVPFSNDSGEQLRYLLELRNA